MTHMSKPTIETKNETWRCDLLLFIASLQESHCSYCVHLTFSKWSSEQTFDQCVFLGYTPRNAFPYCVNTHSPKVLRGFKGYLPSNASEGSEGLLQP